ncbi:hypothetical protein [Nonomuraea sp. NPDC049400]|uniref:hypothetical protein n=1 Tax=Nonomuraea sp. NPDC049400 TaxID=3364352 RepID=UPI0037B12597
MSKVPVYTHDTAPAPIITITPGEPRALLSGIVFGWWSTCVHCRRVIDLYAEDGQILIELQPGGACEGVRWRREHQAKQPAVPNRCPKCGESKWQPSGAYETQASSSVGFVGSIVDAAVQAVYAQLSVDFPHAAEATGKGQYDTVAIGRAGGS